MFKDIYEFLVFVVVMAAFSPILYYQIVVTSEEKKRRMNYSLKTRNKKSRNDFNKIS